MRVEVHAYRRSRGRLGIPQRAVRRMSFYLGIAPSGSSLALLKYISLSQGRTGRWWRKIRLPIGNKPVNERQLHPLASLSPEDQRSLAAHCLRSITAATSCAPTPPSTRKNPSQRHRVSTSLFTKGNCGNATIFSKGSSTSREIPQNAKENKPTARDEGLRIIAAIKLPKIVPTGIVV